MVTRTKKVFVGGLSAPTTLEDVKNYFQQFGRVSVARVERVVVERVVVELVVVGRVVVELVVIERLLVVAALFCIITLSRLIRA